MVPRHALARALRPTFMSIYPRLILSFGRPLLRAHSTSKSDVDDGETASRSSTISTRIRSLMRSTPHPLTTIISYASNASSSKGAPNLTAYGLLVSSFNTITLEPEPYVSFNIKRPSRTYDAIYQSNSFTASNMSDARIAHAFVKHDASSKGWEHMVGDGGRLKDGEGGTWWMSCRLSKDKCVQIGDHVVIVGEVLIADAYPGGEEKMGLVYAHGSYRRVGDIADVNETDQDHS